MIAASKEAESLCPGKDLCPPTLGVTRNATQNACSMCAPLGAALAFAGLQGCVSILHGSQGCATYIRRYLISHFREPMDIASSSFSEQDAVFGGARNLKIGIENIRTAYAPAIIGVATTCLAETIGEDVDQILREYKKEYGGAKMPELIPTSTASYSGDHWEGYHKTVRSILEFVGAANHGETTEEKVEAVEHLLLPGLVSCADLRLLKSYWKEWGLPMVMLPDYSDTLDGGSWSSYQRIPEGGTELERLRDAVKGVSATCFGSVSGDLKTAGYAWLKRNFPGSVHSLPLPLGIRAVDALCEHLENLSDRPTPDHLIAERSRLVDALVDGHKYLAGKRAVVHADPDLAVAMAGFLSEIGVHVEVVATGGQVEGLEQKVHACMHPDAKPVGKVIADADFATLAEHARSAKPDFMVGSSKAYPICRELSIPLLRCGMPVHDRIGAQRIQHLGYAGTQHLYDSIVNLLLQHRQDSNSIGFSYL